MNQEELNDVVRLHGLWLRRTEGGKRAVLMNANLIGADLCAANLTKANMRGANLSSACLEYAVLTGADLTGANLSGANLRYARLQSAQLRSSNLTGSDANGADMRDVCFRGASMTLTNLIGASLQSADLTGADFGRAIFGDTALDGAAGVKHWSAGWHGLGSYGGRLLAVDTGSGVRYSCGCTRGDREHILTYINEGVYNGRGYDGGEEGFRESRLMAVRFIDEMIAYDARAEAVK